MRDASDSFVSVERDGRRVWEIKSKNNTNEGSLFFVRSPDFADTQYDLLTDSITLEAKFGKFSIPLNKIRGIKFHINAENEAVIAFVNGDYVQGKPIIEKLSVENSQGTLELGVSRIDSVLRDASNAFKVVNRDGHKVWKIRSKKN